VLGIPSCTDVKISGTESVHNEEENVLQDVNLHVQTFKMGIFMSV
jgi:hypothetical protein